MSRLPLTALKYWIELSRSRKGRTWGLLWWNLRDGWPIISDGVVDYYFGKKKAYDAIKVPYNTYGAEEVGGQIQALLENGLDGGFMAWNAMCSIPKLETLKPAFDALPD